MWQYSQEVNLNELLESNDAAIIFKHSNSCSISSMALSRTLKAQEEIESKAVVYLIDVKANRNLSLEVADHLGVRHESPQIIIIQDGKVVYDASHFNINPQTILSYL
jgi:bacillithiol system protein YtxJ